MRMRLRLRVRHAKEALTTTAVVACVAAGIGALPAPAHAEVCPNAASRSGLSGSLPDCRVYEMVSPVKNEDGNVYVPNTGPEGDAVSTSVPVRAAANGDAVAYVGDPSSEGNGSIGKANGNNYLAARAPAGGWTTHDIEPAGLKATYQAFSSDLSVGILYTNEIPPGTGVPEELAGYDLLYSRTNGDGAYHPLFTTKPPNRHPGDTGAADQFGASFPAGGAVGSVATFYAGANAGTGTVPAFSHILLEANDALTGNALDPGDETNNLYDSVDGRLTLVNVLPAGAPEPNRSATFGSRAGPLDEPPDFSHDISTDGSRIFWSSLNGAGVPEDLYVRENGAETVLIAEGARFWTANSEGTEAFFTKGDLYEWHEVDGTATSTDLTPGVEVLGVLGASEDGKYVYYVDASYNLDLWHDGTTTFIATLSPGDNHTHLVTTADVESGDWRLGLGQRSAEVTPDGHSVVFMSERSLTGYDNVVNGEAMREVYVFNTEAEPHLSCVSCDPSGAPPATGYERNAAFLPLPFAAEAGNSMNSYQPRWISEDGSRVFFDSEEPLVSQDKNGLQAVYEWERDGAGGCHTKEGCVYLLSGGTSSDISALVDASASGNDVFLATRAQLVPQDRGENDNLYDVRVDGVQPLVAPACTGTGCQGVPSAPPLFATPPSVTFNGVGNLEPPPPAPAVKPKPKAKAKQCKQGYVKKHGRCVKKKRPKAKKATAKGGKRHV